MYHITSAFSFPSWVSFVGSFKIICLLSALPKIQLEMFVKFSLLANALSGPPCSIFTFLHFSSNFRGSPWLLERLHSAGLVHCVLEVVFFSMRLLRGSAADQVIKSVTGALFTLERVGRGSSPSLLFW